MEMFTIIKNEFMSAKLQTGNDCRIVFYDSDDHYFDDWVVDCEDISSEMSCLYRDISTGSEREVVDFLAKSFPDLMIFRPDTMDEYCNAIYQNGKEFVNRIGHTVFVHEG